ncbi:hypothetical protein [Zunongwangia sp.]|uniref:hypothetical protein n=1 Tax=Zunongwangia sp. TaxID=1965325 RepID=UPI003AA7EEF4
MSKKWQKSILFFVMVYLIPIVSNAQCAMCRAVLESEGSQDAAKGVNDGIVYLMVFPYLLIGGLGYYIYRSYKAKKS